MIRTNGPDLCDLQRKFRENDERNMRIMICKQNQDKDDNEPDYTFDCDDQDDNVVHR